MGFLAGQKKPVRSGIKKGSKHVKTVVRQRVHEILATAGKHPIKELLMLMPDLKPETRAKVWLELLQYLEPKLTAQAITVDDKRDSDEADVIDVTPLSDEELIKKAQEAE
jgi:hypothetical protein